jgi:hypothetical protein
MRLSANMIERADKRQAVCSTRLKEEIAWWAGVRAM